MKVRLTVEQSFLDAVRDLPPDRQKRVRAALERFTIEPTLASLHFRRLQGTLNYFIINAAHGDRLILRKDDDTTYAVVDVGPHDNVYRRWNR
ncbi:MAG: hypothetical protein C5B58_10300 [Acidobacteria bacterium]|nr:MAG: hypothetical protein C5B58_10300 [Acidobacteriota bacterium]